MPVLLSAGLIYAVAALAEIAGCFAFWAWLRQGHRRCGRLPAFRLSSAFARLLPLAASEHARRAYAAYGGVYIVASLFWLWVAEGQAPDSWDLAGGALALVAAAIILFAPRG